jgi:hypothetical protein
MNCLLYGIRFQITRDTYKDQYMMVSEKSMSVSIFQGGGTNRIPVSKMATNNEGSASHHNATRPTPTTLAPRACGEGHTGDLIEYLFDTTVVF